MSSTPPPSNRPLGCLVQVDTGASPQVLCLVCCLVVTIFSGVLAFLCIQLFDRQGGTKGSALCGVLSPSTPPWSDLALLCAAALSYSSLMFQAPLWMFTDACVHPLWSSCAFSPSFRCCRPAPCLLLLCWCPCVVSRSAPPLCCPFAWFLLLPLLFLSILWLLLVPLSSFVVCFLW